MGPNNYPGPGYEWHSQYKTELPSEHAEAQRAEQFTHELMNFRADLWQMLASKNVLADGNGWAIFTVTEDGSSVATADYKEVLIQHGLPESEQPFSGVAAVVRITSKEQIDAGDGNLRYLIEDVMFDLDNYAVYSIDTLTFMVDGETVTLPDEFEGKPIPMFDSRQDGSYWRYKSFPDTPVQLVIADSAGTNRKIWPFGRPKNYDDRHYALMKAKELVAEVRDLEPTFQSAKRA